MEPEDLKMDKIVNFEATEIKMDVLKLLASKFGIQLTSNQAVNIVCALTNIVADFAIQSDMEEEHFLLCCQDTFKSCKAQHEESKKKDKPTEI